MDRTVSADFDRDSPSHCSLTVLESRLVSSTAGMDAMVRPCWATRPVSVITTASNVVMATGTISTCRNVALASDGEATTAT